MSAFPIDVLLPEIRAAVAPGSTTLLQAPPGAGKTTRVPLALIGALGGAQTANTPSGQIWMLEPRRLAARAAASRLAESLDEAIGHRIGYSVRGESRRSRHTQVEVMTDGLFLRRLQADPSLDGVSCVLFDEFHERRRDADLAFTLLAEARPLLNAELAVVVMSATLDLSDLRTRLPEATVLESEGRAYPVVTIHQPPRSEEPLPRQVLRAIESHALALPQGSGVLVFLPGLKEIRRCQNLLAESASLANWSIRALHGQMPLSEQSTVLQRCGQDQSGSIVLSSAIAESSVTVDGVVLVIDSGLSRQLRYDPNTGMEGLETVPASLASADQRRGRAGRQGPGCCVRLWSPAEQQRRPAFSPPELQLADPLPLVMELAQWGAGRGEQLPWLDPPSGASLAEGQQQLQTMGVLTSSGALTDLGKQLSHLSVHPRLGLLMLEAQHQGCADLGCDLAALLSDRDPLAGRRVGADLSQRLDVLHRQRDCRPQQQLSRQLRQQLAKLTPSDREPLAPASAAELLLRAFPDWLALQRDGQPGRYQLRQGRGAVLMPDDPLWGTPALAVARLDMGERDCRIQLALPLSQESLDRLAKQDGRWHDTLRWDPDQERIQARRQLRLGQLVLRDDTQPAPAAERCRALLIQRLEQAGSLGELPWTDQSEQLRCRLDLIHRNIGDPWPDRSVNKLLQTLDSWLGPSLEGCQSWRDLHNSALEEALWGDIPWSQRQELDRLAPARLTIPSGRQAALRYGDDEVVLAVKLQEMFGSSTGPTVLNGRLPVTLELLSPAGRSLQRTRDLRGFWQGSYRDVRREMRGRYPKHPWPENPAEAIATAKTKRWLKSDQT